MTFYSSLMTPSLPSITEKKLGSRTFWDPVLVFDGRAEQVGCVLTVCLHHPRDVEPLTHPHDTHAIVEIESITGKRGGGVRLLAAPAPSPPPSSCLGLRLPICEMCRQNWRAPRGLCARGTVDSVDPALRGKLSQASP